MQKIKKGRLKGIHDILLSLINRRRYKGRREGAIKIKGKLKDLEKIDLSAGNI